MKYKRAIYWFRKSLRLHDNPALLYALKNSKEVFPIFILDPWFVANYKVGVNRWRFLIESLQDLNRSLQKKNSGLILIRGNPTTVFPEFVKKWGIDLVCFEKDTEPYSTKRDNDITTLLKPMGVNVHSESAHTLYDLEFLYVQNAFKTPLTYSSFQELLYRVGPPPMAVQEPETMPKLSVDLEKYPVPATLKDINVDESLCGPLLYPGGETEALRRLREYMEKEAWVCQFEKPNTSPNSIDPSTTVLSPYMKFGCLSSRLFFHEVKRIYSKNKNHSSPPCSLEGQLYWREFFYLNAAFTPNFDKISGNPVCRQIKWDEDEELLRAWKEARTGFPFIDAIMTQLRTEGWIHHLARHAVACFLTRGDLYQSWEKGKEVFEEWLLDADWSLNAGNWMWLSASAFFHQYFRIYSPVEFGKKTDKNGDYIRKYIPVLKHMPKEYIFEPWRCPIEIQKKIKCIIGKDYPSPVVDHKQKSAENKERFKVYFAKNNESDESGREEVEEKGKTEKKKEKLKATKETMNIKPVKKRKALENIEEEKVPKLEKRIAVKTPGKAQPKLSEFFKKK